MAHTTAEKQKTPSSIIDAHTDSLSAGTRISTLPSESHAGQKSYKPPEELLERDAQPEPELRCAFAVSISV
jgi:hypothetical protein